MDGLDGLVGGENTNKISAILEEREMTSPIGSHDTPREQLVGGENVRKISTTLEGNEKKKHVGSQDNVREQLIVNMQRHDMSGLGEGCSSEATLKVWKNEATKVEDG